MAYSEHTIPGKTLILNSMWIMNYTINVLIIQVWPSSFKQVMLNRISMNSTTSLACQCSNFLDTSNYQTSSSCKSSSLSLALALEDMLALELAFPSP